MSGRFFCIVNIFFGFAFFLSLQFARAEGGQNQQSPETLFVMCAADRLFVDSAESAILKGYANPRDDGSYVYDWVVTEGRIEGAGPIVKWNLESSLPGIYRVTLYVINAQGHSASTSVEMNVIRPVDLKAGNLMTGRRFLAKGANEDEGYGLYSYLLLGSRGDDSKRERCRSAIVEYLKLSKTAELLELLKDKKEINITYLFLKKTAEKVFFDRMNDESEKGYSEAASWILNNYDYERSEDLLRKLDVNWLYGPFIVSFKTPLTMQGSVEFPYLFQDHSVVPPDLISLWTREFIMQAAQEHFWDTRSMNHIILVIRTYLGIIGEGFPQVINELNKIIQLKDKFSGTHSATDRAMASYRESSRITVGYPFDRPIRDTSSRCGLGVDRPHSTRKND